MPQSFHFSRRAHGSLPSRRVARRALALAMAGAASFVLSSVHAEEAASVPPPLMAMAGTSGPGPDGARPPPGAGPQGPGPHRPPGGPDGAPLPPLVGAWFGPAAERALGDVQATPEQRERIQSIGRDLHQALRQSHQTLRPLEVEMAALFAKPTLDAGALDALRRRIDEQRSVDSRRVLDASLAAANVLSAEQRSRYVERLASLHQGREDMGGHPHRPGGPRMPDAVPPPADLPPPPHS